MSYISAYKQRDSVIVWEKDENNKLVSRAYDSPYYFYIESKEGTHKSLYGHKLTRYDFADWEEFNEAKNQCRNRNITMFESDIQPEFKILSQHYYGKPNPQLNVTFYDIEVDYDPKVGHATCDNPYAPLNAVALFHRNQNRMAVIAVPPEDATCDIPALGKADAAYIKKMHDLAPIISGIEIDITFVRNEHELLKLFLKEIAQSDVICGWNNSGFDDPYTGKRLEKLGRKYFKQLSYPGAPLPKWDTRKFFGREQPVINLFGRVSLDYMVLFKKYMVENQASYKLENIADKFLRTDDVPDMPKLAYTGTLAGLYRGDFDYFIRYNIRDTEILQGFENKMKYVETANTMVHSSTGQFTNVAGTIKLTELAVINHCHHKLGVVVNDKAAEPDPEYDEFGELVEDDKIKGALVLDPVMGMHEWTSSVDLNSLYPSAARTCNISPETKIGQFDTDERAYEEIAGQTDKILEFTYVSGKTEKRTAIEWRKTLLKNNCCISGFGTVFTMDRKGVIPEILEGWYADRKKFQKKMVEAKDFASDILKASTAKKGTMRKGIALTKVDAADYDELITEAEYCDNMQYVLKIKLNSAYGALCNDHFKFSDKSLGESITACGRRIVVHQHREANRLLTGKYDEFGDALIYGDSVSGDTIIHTDRGPIPIEKLFTSTDATKGTKEYCNITGIKSLTFNEETQSNEYRDIPYVVRHATNKQMYRVWFGNIRYVDVTEDHSLIGYANTRSSTPGQLVCVKPQDIGKKHINSLLLNANTIPFSINSKELPKELYILIGLVLGDGWASDKTNSSVELSVGSRDKKDIIELLQPLVGEWITSIGEKTNTHDIRLHGSKIRKFIMANLYVDGKKTVPAWMFDESIENIGYFLNGWFTADGTVNKGSPKLSSIDLEQIIAANALLSRCGIASNFWKDNTPNSYNGVFSNTFSHVLNVYDAIRFEHYVGFSLERKHTKIAAKYSRRKEHLIGQNGYALIAPTRIETINTPEYVYDIEVAETHKFYGNDILLHNTDSSYFSTYCDNVEDARAVGDEVADGINESFNPWLKKHFLINDDFTGVIRCGRETVADKGIFVKKKKYILHLVDLDGYPVDKLKVMGLDTKRTTIPKPISIALEKFIERLLKGETWDSMEPEIVEYKRTLLRDASILDIGLMSGINKIEEYYAKYLIDPNTRLPGHVAASILYNMLRQQHNDLESPIIMSGTKIRRFNLKKPIGRFKAIAIPTDMTEYEIPQWFHELNIDKKMQLQKLIDSPINNLVHAIGEESPTANSLKFKSLFD